MNWYTNVLRRYADFNGRAGREEYWMFMLFHISVFLVLLGGFPLLGVALGGISPRLSTIAAVVMMSGWGLAALYWLGTILPQLSVTVRRLHDSGNSGGLIFLVLVPLGGIVVFVFMCIAGNPYVNKYGPPPTHPPMPVIAQAYERGAGQG